MKKIVLLSDSHHSLDKRIFPYLEKCDEIWHAGDIGNLEVTDKLKSFAPIRAVWGNIDNHKVKTILAFSVDGNEIKDLKVIEFTRRN